MIQELLLAIIDLTNFSLDSMLFEFRAENILKQNYSRDLILFYGR